MAKANTPPKSSPQQGGAQTPAQQQGQSSTPGQQAGGTVTIRDWASI